MSSLLTSPPRTTFHETDFNRCGNLGDYIYDIYIKSLKSTLDPKDVKSHLEGEFQIVQVEFLFNSTSLLGGTNTYYTFAGIIGRYKNTNYGIIAFRGSKNINEVSIFLSSVVEKNLEKTGLYDVPKEKFKKDTLVGKGWYIYYNEQKPVYRLGNNCICEKKSDSTYQKCRKVSLFAKMTECDKSKPSKNETLLPPLSEQVIRYIKKQSRLKSFQMTGHSLGSAICILSAFHIARAFSPDKILNIYSFAGPTVGNDVFVEEYNQLLMDKTFRIANEIDIITKVPPNHKHVATNEYTFSFFDKAHNLFEHHFFTVGYQSNLARILKQV